MDSGIDTGNIIAKVPLDISGHMSDIFQNMTLASTKLVRQIINNVDNSLFFVGKAQDPKEATFFPRRKPEESELHVQDFATLSGQELFDKISVLEDPYPNAFIITKDGRKLLFKKVEIK